MTVSIHFRRMWRITSQQWARSKEFQPFWPQILNELNSIFQLWITSCNSTENMSLASYNDEYKLERRIKQRIPQMFDEHRYQIPNFEIEKKVHMKPKQSKAKSKPHSIRSNSYCIVTSIVLLKPPSQFESSLAICGIYFWLAWKLNFAKNKNAMWSNVLRVVNRRNDTRMNHTINNFSEHSIEFCWVKLAGNRCI